MAAIYRRNPRTAGRLIDGLAFVVTPKNRLHTLNATATEIWNLAQEGCTAAHAAAVISERYEVDEDTALYDVESCCEDLVRRQILVED